jgi:shikimate dehydrogenase
MSLYAIFGNPVKHSISPILHNYTFNKLNIKSCYTKVLVQDGDSILEKFFNLKLKGINITVPYKEIAYNKADKVMGIAQKIKAVNTWRLKEGKIYAYNTDAPGFYESVEEFDFSNPLIIGAGGTAKAIALYLKEMGYLPTVINRSSKRLDFFIKNSITAYTIDEFEKEKKRDYDLIINTTSAGLTDDVLPAPKELLEELFSNSKYAVDVIYNKLTPFLQLAKAYNLTYKDGTDMLIFQGVLAFEIFTDFKYEKEEIKRLFKEAASLLHI